MSNTTWRKMLTDALSATKESLEDLTFEWCEGVTDAQLDVIFNDGYGEAEGKPFWAWSENYVYVCCEYDGAETVDYVPLRPGLVSPVHL